MEKMAENFAGALDSSLPATRVCHEASCLGKTKLLVPLVLIKISIELDAWCLTIFTRASKIR